MAEIVQLPCNMSCLSDELLTRLADKFTAIECEDLLDKKDRIRKLVLSLYKMIIHIIYNALYVANSLVRNYSSCLSQLSQPASHLVMPPPYFGI